MDKRIWKVYVSRPLLVALLFLFVQHAMVAISTLSVVKLAAIPDERWKAVLWLCIFIACLTLVYLPSSLAQMFLEKARFASLNRYVDRFSEGFFGKAGLRVNEDAKAKHQSFLQTEGAQVIESTLRVVFDFASIVLSVVLNLGVLASEVNSALAVSYAVALPAVALVLRLGKGMLEHYSEQLQSTRAGLMQMLALGWENIVAGNAHCFSLWRGRLGSDLAAARKASVSNLVVTEGFAGIAMLVAVTPIFLVTAWLFLKELGNPAALAVLAATLPRQITLIHCLSDVVNYSSYLTGIRAQNRGIFAALEPEEFAYDKYISFTDLRWLHGGAVQTLASFDDAVKLLGKAGRHTLRGRNGSGKSVLLSLIQSRQTGETLLVPASSSLLFESTSGRSLSHGERVCAILRESRNLKNVSALLLDEWDANLDSEKILELDALIDEIAKERTVLEVRHRGLEQMPGYLSGRERWHSRDAGEPGRVPHLTSHGACEK